jgi:hypothetical protein
MIDDAQRLLLLAAAEPMGDAALFLRAAAQLGIPVDALAPAEAAGVIEFGPRMRFHHPLMQPNRSRTPPSSKQPPAEPRAGAASPRRRHSSTAPLL